MDTKVLHISANILLASGLLLFILTVILSVRFNVIRILKLEFGSEKKASAAEKENAPVMNANSADNGEYIEEDKVFEDVIAEEQPFYEAPVLPAVPPVTENDISDSDTIIISENSEEPDPGDTVLIKKEKRNDSPEDDYRIIENIIDIHGDPAAIK